MVLKRSLYKLIILGQDFARGRWYVFISGEIKYDRIDRVL